MSSLVVVALIACNLGLVFVLMTMPLGVRTIRQSRLVRSSREKLWEAVWPLGRDAGWSAKIASATGFRGGATLTLSWEGRDGQPIQRKVAFDDVVRGERFSMCVVDDSSLDPAFWGHYRETTELQGEGDAIRVMVSQTDRYRGVAFLVFRYFVLRRELGKLKGWAETGRFRQGGWFEHPLNQVGMAILSALIFWPFFGLNAGGLVLSATLIFVVALHELGHMAAFRVMGHRRVRMIFIPFLGGLAIGGRPYDSRFEVAFVALMGAGFSALLLPLLIVGSSLANHGGYSFAAFLLAVLAGCAALFNIANLVPVWKFDGGQVLRQICSGPVALGLCSFALLSAFLALGWHVGVPARILFAAGAIFACLSLLTMGAGVRPRYELRPIRLFDRLAIGAALLAAFVIHGCGLLWASAVLL